MEVSIMPPESFQVGSKNVVVVVVVVVVVPIAATANGFYQS
jgi:hypothetical protein